MNYPGRVKSPPQEYTSGSILWLILGGRTSDIEAAAAALDVADLPTLLNAKEGLSRKVYEHKNWRTVFETLYTKGWAENGALFESLLLGPKPRSGTKPKEPDDKESIGYLLWLMLGDDNIDQREAKRLLQDNNLDSVLQGRRTITQQHVREKKWRDVLKTHHPITWAIYAAEFERRVATLAPTPKTPVKEPADKNSFGHALWLVIGEKKADSTAAARILSIDANYLGAILQNRRKLSAQFIKEKNWRALLATAYPEGWGLHAATFEASVVRLKARRGGTLEPPQKKESIGYEVWRIIGGNKLRDLAPAATHLHVSVRKLSAVIHGHTMISQKFIEDHAWRTAFATHYARLWKARQQFFESYAAELSWSNKNPSQEPAKKGRFGHVLWLILGGKAANVSESAKLLSAHKSRLSDILHNKVRPPQKLLADNRWFDVLCEHHPETWALHGPELQRLAAALPPLYGHRIAQPARPPAPATTAIVTNMRKKWSTELKKDWRAAVSEFVTHVMTVKKTDIRSLARAASIQVLKNEDTWARILSTDDPPLSASVYRDAVAEISRRYDLRDLHDGSHIRAEELIGRTRRAVLQAHRSLKARNTAVFLWN